MAMPVNVLPSKPHPFKILIVDDDPTVLESTALILERAGYCVEKTTDVFGLPLRVGNFRPEMILLDMDLPATRGDTLAKNLRHLRVMSDCRIVFHSASIHPSSSMRCKAGYNDPSSTFSTSLEIC